MNNPQWQCKACNDSGMSNCGNFDECGGPRPIPGTCAASAWNYALQAAKDNPKLNYNREIDLVRTLEELVVGDFKLK